MSRRTIGDAIIATWIIRWCYYIHKNLIFKRNGDRLKVDPTMITNPIHLASKYRDFILNRTYETHESAASTVITVSKTRNVQKLEKKKKKKGKREIAHTKIYKTWI